MVPPCPCHNIGPSCPVSNRFNSGQKPQRNQLPTNFTATRERERVSVPSERESAGRNSQPVLNIRQITQARDTRNIPRAGKEMVLYQTR